ncbi:hypothetical protein SCRES3_gp51 [Synechococcus phage S-CRES3]|nr:hypothetical protein SCRES3_gp51 [Synechococcus phage S-CRES3]
MARRKLTNYQQLSRDFILEQLFNVNTCINRHKTDSPEALYLMGERQILLEQLEAYE